MFFDYDNLAIPEIHTGRKKLSAGSDCTLPVDDGYVSIRVGAIIIKDGKVLMVKNERQNYMYSVGGRVKFGETSIQAVEREVYEETGVHMEVDRLGFVHENYFYADDNKKKGKVIYEISFYYFMNVPGEFRPVCNSVSEDNDKEKLEWIEVGSNGKYYPEFFRTELNNPCDGVKHIVTMDINK